MTSLRFSQSIKSGKIMGRLAGLALLLSATLWAPGCASHKSTAPTQGGRPASSARNSSSAAAWLPTFSDRNILLIRSPLDVRSDYVYPPYFMRQKLSWTDSQSQWFMTFPSRRYAYAGIELKKKVDVTKQRDQTKLSFRMRPARLAQFLSIALVDRPTNQAARAMTDYWIKEAGPFEGEGWAKIEIALTNFSDEALPVVDAENANPDVLTAPRRSFDWTAISEIRFVSGSGRIPNQEIIVKELCFQR